MWKSVVGHNVKMKVDAEGDDWETDPDFENDISEQEQRWGAKTVEGSGRPQHISIAELRNKVSVEHEQVKQKEDSKNPKASYGYGGRFGVEKDRMDKVAVGHNYVAQVEQHSSQTDAARGFGGKFGVQKDRVDKVRRWTPPMGFEYKAEVTQHASQKDYSKGFGGKYGVEKEKVDKVAVGYDYTGKTEKHQSQKDLEERGKYGVEMDKMDKAALGYNYIGETEKHQSQKDYSKGFGGKFGVEEDKVDKAALRYDYKGETEKHQSQKDYSAGFGGRYGIQSDRMDKSAAGFSDMDSPTSAYEKTQPFEASSIGAENLKQRFESMAKTSGEEQKKKAEEERARRQAREKREQEEARRRQQQKREREEETAPPPVPAAAPEYDRVLPEIHQHLQVTEEPEGEPEYEEPPALPPRSADFLDDVLLPAAEEDDDGLYEDFTEPPPPADLDNDYEDICGQKAVAIYDYQGEADDEISFNPDDIITNIEMIDEGWWRGECHGHAGLFPAAYVKLME
ncbi:hematopoietic lineage cell-specific protein [Thalassophryne amazonica]|uniref:hematopoietic lineage cell-specific protein n=1 Tax=Thalassophryne amazonica TaxID=390379 RepID=UPI0014717DA0|nr:hematopoietic lineage cell-specific protein [Thalassophryne amazonica]